QTPQRWLYGAEGEILLSRIPSDVAATKVPALGAAAVDQDRSASPPIVRRTSKVSTPRGPRRRLQIGAAVVAVVAVVVAAAIWSNRNGDGNETSGNTDFAVAKEGTFASTGPW